MKTSIYLSILILLFGACSEPESPLEELVDNPNITELNQVLEGELLGSKGKLKRKTYFYFNKSTGDYDVDYYYDKAGNPILEITTNKENEPSGYVLNYFDNKGLMTSSKVFIVGEFGLTFFSNRKYEYNLEGRLKNVLIGDGTDFKILISNTYDDQGRIKSTSGRVTGEGDFAEFFYSDGSKKISEEHFYYDRSAGIPYYVLQYEYDLDGNLIAKKPKGQIGTDESFMEFKYNNQNQVVEEILYSLQFGQQVLNKWKFTYFE